MKVLRSSMYPPEVLHPGGEAGMPVTTVVRESDLAVPIAEAMGNQPGTFIAYEVFELEEDAGITAATFQALERMGERLEIERNQAIAYYFIAAQLFMLADEGVYSTTEPSPLTREEIIPVLLQLAAHPSYKRQWVTIHDRDGKPVTMMEGEPVWQGDKRPEWLGG